MASNTLYSGTVVVAGATGRTGQWVVKRLQHYGVRVRVFCRDRDKALSLFGKDVECVSGLIQSATDIANAVKGCTAVISALGSGAYSGESSPGEVDRDGVIRLVDEAAKAGVKHFALVSSMAVTRWYHPLNLFAGVLLKKWDAEEHVRKVFSQADRSYTIARPGGLKDGEPLRHRLHVDTGDKLWSGWINRSDVAELLVISLWVEKAKNRTFEVINEIEENQQSLESCYSNLPE
ncbi:MAG: SDR family oxidoreductase [Chlorobiaceae bacterium]|nr:SDR family oxidoreductase [Chlorobiaceae bacterium]